VVGDVMPPVVVRLHVFQELRMELLDAMRANSGDDGLHAQFEQAQHDIVVTMAKLRALEAQWASVPGRHRWQRHSFS
jgi:energy-converting hydrogenase A subunit M